MKEPFPVNPVYMPIKSKTKHKGVARPLRELLPSVNTEERKFQEDMLESFKEVSYLLIMKLTMGQTCTHENYVGG